MRCAAKECYNAQGCRPNLKFFGFPKENERCRIWAESCERLDILNIAPEKRFRFKLCADHFESDLFLNPLYKTVFKPNIEPIPTVFQNNLIDFVPKALLRSSTSLKNENSSVPITPTNLHVELKLSPPKNVDGSSINNEELYNTGVKTTPCHKMCRLCASLVHEDKLTDIFVQDSKKIIVQINKVLDEQASADDELPPYVCSSCEKKLDDCEATIESFIAAQNKLKELLNTPWFEDFSNIPVILDESEIKSSEPEIAFDKNNLCSEANAKKYNRVQEKLPVITQQDNVNICQQVITTDIEPTVQTLENQDSSTLVHQIVEASENLFPSVPDTVCAVNENSEVENVTNTLEMSDVLANLEIPLNENICTHKCSYCEEHFDKQETLFIHELDKHIMNKESVPKHVIPVPEKLFKNRRYECTLCKNICIGKTAFQRHIRNDHFPPQNVCQFCGKRYAIKSHLDAHLRIHTNEKPYTCNTCKETFRFRKEFRRHTRTHIKPRKGLTCRICEKTFKAASVLWRHEKIHDNSAHYLCYLCGKKLATAHSLNVHIRITHSSERQYSCPTCVRTFRDIDTLNRHIVKHSGERSYACLLCSRAFFTQSLLNQHMLIHTGEKPYKCDVCGSSFNRYGNLTQHKKKHKGNTPYKFGCEVCGKMLRSELTLKYHLAKHTGEKKPYDCQICDKRFTTLEPYKVHMRIHTGERPFACNICGKSFRSSYTMKQHCALHKDECPYPCPFCDRKFKRLQSLLVHKRTHTGEKPFECPICLRCFAQRGDMLKHTKTHRKLQDTLISSVTGEELVLEIDQITELDLNGADIPTEFLIDIPIVTVEQA